MWQQTTVDLLAQLFDFPATQANSDGNATLNAPVKKMS